MEKIKIVIIDSGLDPIHFLKNERIRAFYNVLETAVIESEQLSDTNGHGTACAYIIDSRTKECDIYIYRIFDDNLLTCNEKLILALEHCKRIRPNIVNLSLGTIKTNEKLNSVCKSLSELGCILVAATSDDNVFITWPASYEYVIKVVGDSENREMQYYFGNSSQLTISAYSGQQRVAWKEGKYNIVYGNSFACARVSAEIAKIMREINSTDKELVFKYIFKNYSQKKVPPAKKKEEIDFSALKNVMLYPFNKEMHSLFRFKDYLPFSIVKIVDLPFMRTVNKKAGEILGISDMDEIIIKSNFRESLDDSVDTVILGDLSELTRIYNKNLNKKYAEIAFSKGKNVVSIELLKTKVYSEIKQLAYKYKCEFISLNDILDKENIAISYGKRVSKPVVAILGTGPKVGKFTVQVSLKTVFEKVGYRVVSIGTEPQSFLFGMPSFPLGNYNLLEHIPLEDQISKLKALMASLEQQKEPDIIFVGGQSGVVPFNGEIDVDYNSLSSIITILSTKPDAVILCVNPDDEIEYIKRTVNGIEAFGYGKVIICAISSLSKNIEYKKGMHYEIRKFYDCTKMQEKVLQLEKEINIPAINILDERHIVKCVENIQKAFSV